MRSPGLGLCTLALLALPLGASAYPGGTPAFQADAAPVCAGCHSSRTVEMLAGAPGGRAEKELVENKHFPLIEKGEGGYEELEPAQRTELIRQIPYGSPQDHGPRGIGRNSELPDERKGP